jgi:peptidoglycan/xylan/chitin deacetylase (PgdA/CDA1 family)
MTAGLIKKAIAATGGWRPFRWFNRSRPIILMYHGLTNNPAVDDWTQVPVAEFEKQMDFLVRHYRVTPLAELVQGLEAAEFPPYTAAVTFDDGYRSNHSLAYPILKRRRIPATFFVTSGFINNQGMAASYLWPDFVTALALSHPGPTLDLRPLDLGQWQLSSRRTRYDARAVICERLKSLPDPDRQSMIHGLAGEFGGSIDPDRFGDYCPMSPSELRELAADDLITIGAHSRTHPILSRLGRERLIDEVVGSKEDLEAMIGKTVTCFAYPNGRRQDINRDTVTLVAERFDCAVTTEAGVNPAGQNKYLLRRIGVGRNLPLSQFALLISGVRFVLQKPAYDL